MAGELKGELDVQNLWAWRGPGAGDTTSTDGVAPPLFGTCEDAAGSSTAGRSSKLEITCAAGAKGHSWAVMTGTGGTEVEQIPSSSYSLIVSLCCFHLQNLTEKCCTQYARKFGKLSSGHRTGKGQFSFQSQRKAVPKNVQTTGQLHSFYKLER